VRKFRWVAIFGLFISLAAAEAAPPSVPLIPTAEFAALPFIQKPVLSPDGRSIAAQRIVDGKTMIVIFDVDRADAVAKTVPVGKPTVASMRWAGNSKLLLQVRFTQRVGAINVPVLRLVSIDAEAGSVQILDAKSRGIYAGDLLYVDPNGRSLLVSSQADIYSTPSVKRIDLTSGASTEVEKARANIWRWYADENGAVRAGVAYDGARYTIWYRESANDSLHEIHGKLQNADDSSVDRLIFHGGNIWVLTNARTGRFGVYDYDVKTGAIGQAVFEHPEVDVDDVLFNATTGDLSGVRYQDERPRVFWRDPQLKILQSQLDLAVPNAINLPMGWSNDQQRVLVWSASGADPGRYFLLDRNSRQMHAVAESYPDIDPDQLAPVHPVRYQARDGLQLRAYLTLPRGRDPKSLPLIVFPHGGPFARDEGTYDPTAQFLANRGYAVLQPEVRGSTGFGKDFVAKGYGQVGKAMQDDLDDGVDWLIRSGQVDPKRVCIVGMSYGGYAAMWGAIRNPDRYRCAASWAGLSDLPSIMHYDVDQFSASRYFRNWRKQFATDEELRTVSPIRYAERMKVPMLIGHGEDDDTVPPEQSHRMVKALTAAGANVTSVFYKNSKHSFGSSKDFEDWLAHLGAFLAKYNPA
jgi:dipeptidyl aminopeptidase/acylaminoacyl peptidase